MDVETPGVIVCTCGGAAKAGEVAPPGDALGPNAVGDPAMGKPGKPGKGGNPMACMAMMAAMGLFGSRGGRPGIGEGMGGIEDICP